MTDYFPPVTDEIVSDEESEATPDVPAASPEVSEPVAAPQEPEPVQEAPAAPVGLTQEQAYASSLDPTTPSPFKPTPGVCGHCGDAYHVENQGHNYLCHGCGKWSDLNGNKIDGNPHARANMSTTFAWANSL